MKVATYDDGVRHVIGLTQDVTQQRRDEAALREALEQGRQAERARHAFLATISHELRTPLNGVMAGVELLSGGTEAGTKPEVLEMIQSSARSLVRRLEDLIRVAQLDPKMIILALNASTPGNCYRCWRRASARRRPARAWSSTSATAPTTSSAAKAPASPRRSRG